MCNFALSSIMLCSARRRWHRLWVVTIEPPLMSISATLMLFSVTATVRGVPHSLPASGSAPCSSISLVTASQLYFAAMCRGVFKCWSTRLTSTPCVVSSRTILRSLFTTAQWITEWPLILLALTRDPSFKMRAASEISFLNTAWKSSSLMCHRSIFVQNFWVETDRRNEACYYHVRWEHQWAFHSFMTGK